jgi:hypothetical protein
MKEIAEKAIRMIHVAFRDPSSHTRFMLLGNCPSLRALHNRACLASQYEDCQHPVFGLPMVSMDINAPSILNIFKHFSTTNYLFLVFTVAYINCTSGIKPTLLANCAYILVSWCLLRVNGS